MTAIVYSLDSSVIINLVRHQPQDIFKTLWRNLQELANDDRLVVHTSVIDELGRQDDAAFAWVKQLPTKARVEIDQAQADFITRMTQEHAHLAYRMQQTRYANSADPFIVAAGFTRSHWIVSDENRREWKLHDICRRYGVKSVDTFGLFREEEWEF